MDGGLGVKAGKGLLIIDCDVKVGVNGVSNLQALYEAAGEALPSATAFTGSGGVHYWLRVPAGVRTPPNTQTKG